MAVRSYGPDTGFGYECNVTLALEIWPWVKVMTHSWVMDNNHVKYYTDPTWQWRVMARANIFWYVCTVNLTLEVWPWAKVMTYQWVMDNNCVKCYPDPTWQWGVMAWTRIFGTLHNDLDLSDMTFGQGHDTPLGHGQQVCEILFRSITAVRSNGPDTDFGYSIFRPSIIQIQRGSEELWSGHRFPVYVHCDLDLGIMNLGEGHDTPFGHGQQLLKYYPDKWVRSYGTDMMWIDGQTDRLTDRQTDGQTRRTDRVIPIYPQN